MGERPASGLCLMLTVSSRYPKEGFTVINANKPDRWKDDIAFSVDLYNRWFLEFAPKAFRETRAATVHEVAQAMRETKDLARIGPSAFRGTPNILRTLRMSTAPPLAVDRLVGLAYTKPSVIKNLEQNRLPPRMKSIDLRDHLERIAATLSELLDIDLFPWLVEGRCASDAERLRAASVVADRLCGAIANPIIRNAQEQRQLDAIKEFLTGLEYRERSHPTDTPLQHMEPGTFAFRMNIRVDTDSLPINIPADIVIQPTIPAESGLPVLVEAKSAGDFANTNKRRKEEATKVRQLRSTYGPELRFLLFLGGYFNPGYLGYEAAEGIDWVWEHRIDDLMELGL